VAATAFSILTGDDSRRITPPLHRPGMPRQGKST
jgi:hypothetical protein